MKIPGLIGFTALNNAYHVLICMNAYHALNRQIPVLHFVTENKGEKDPFQVFLGHSCYPNPNAKEIVIKENYKSMYFITIESLSLP